MIGFLFIMRPTVSHSGIRKGPPFSFITNPHEPATKRLQRFIH